MGSDQPEEALVLIAGLLLLLVAIAMVCVAVLGGGDASTLDMGPVNLEANATVVFFLGMATLLLFVCSVMLFRAAGRRAAARRRDRKKVSELSAKLQEFERDRKDDREPAPE
ncbi:MAG: hypothetical protein EOO74_04235 [Myxococcales bacterium]|nr:MAG: hypothetical protein EOO74_04235 [Myxococcales bacterium]